MRNHLYLYLEEKSVFAGVNMEHGDACEGAYKRGNFSATISPVAGRLSLETRGGYLNKTSRFSVL